MSHVTTTLCLASFIFFGPFGGLYPSEVRPFKESNRALELQHSILRINLLRFNVRSGLLRTNMISQTLLFNNDASSNLLTFLIHFTNSEHSLFVEEQSIFKFTIIFYFQIGDRNSHIIRKHYNFSKFGKSHIWSN